MFSLVSAIDLSYHDLQQIAKAKYYVLWLPGIGEGTSDKGPVPCCDSVFSPSTVRRMGPCPLLNTPLLKMRQTVPPTTLLPIPDAAFIENSRRPITPDHHNNILEKHLRYLVTGFSVCHCNPPQPTHAELIY
jgi:hypothetical protein